MADDAELEIGLYRDGGVGYAVELRFQRLDGSAERAPVRGRAPIDMTKLRGLEMPRPRGALSALVVTVLVSSRAR